MTAITTPAITGRVKGAGETTYEFTYISPSQERSKVGEYVHYVHRAGGDELRVLCRVTAINPLRAYPHEMLSNPDLDPVLIAESINYLPEGMELYEITAQIVGFFDDRNKTFVNPRALPRTGDPVYLTSKEDLVRWLFFKKPEDDWGIDIGTLLNRPGENVRVVLDMDRFTSTHMAVLAATGSGKSYTVGVILEELMRPVNRAAVLVFDPHGEYGTLRAIEAHPKFQGHDGYSPVVRVVKPGDIHIKFSELAFGELVRMLEGSSDKMHYVLREVLQELRKKSPNYATDDVIAALKARRDVVKTEESTIDGLLWRLHEFVKNRKLISDSTHMRLPDLLKPGQATILDMVELEERDQQLTTSVLLNRVLKSRISVVRGMGIVQEEEKLEFPVFVVLEEGHRFAPANDDSSSKRVLKTILSEGRKFGIGVLIVSQRPAKLDSDVLSQCMSQIIMRITNPMDQQNIKNSVEHVSAEIMNELPGLTRGQAIVTGDAVTTSVMVQVRERIAEHGGRSASTGKEWRAKWKPAPVVDRKFDDGPGKPLY